MQTRAVSLRSKLVLMAVLALLISGAAQLVGAQAPTAEVVVAWVSANGTTVNPAVEAAGVTGAALSRGAGVSENSGSTFNSNGWSVGGDLSTAQANEDYIEWGFSSTTAYNLTTMDIRYDRSGTGPSSIVIQVAINGSGVFQTIFTDDAVDASGEENSDIDLSSLDEVTSATFRLFGFGGTSSGGTFDIENSSNFNGNGLVIYGVAATTPPTPPAVCAAGQVVVAVEDFDGNAVNLVSGFNPATDNLDGGGGDFFGVGSRNAWPQSTGVPFSLGDDSAFDYSGGGIFAADAEGVFGQNSDLDNDYFGISDSDEFGSAQAASWTFNVAGYENLELRLGMGGVSDSSFGGFSESTDVVFAAQIDGGASQTAFDLVAVDASFTTRPMDSGSASGGGRVLEVSGDNAVSKLLAEDGSTAANTYLDKTPASGDAAGELDTFVTTINGTGSELVLNLTADFPFEAMAFDNIVICGTAGQTEVRINEVDADSPGTDTAEFVELFDGGVGNTALDGLSLVFFNGSDDASYEAFDLDGQTTDADGYFVLCGDATFVANCDLDVSPNSNLIQNGADAVALFQDDAANFPNDTPVTTVNLLDAIVYDTNDGDDSALLPLLNAGQSQVNEDGAGDKDNHANQRCPNGSGGLRNTDAYQQFAPTPGEVNTCKAPDPEPILTLISAIQGAGASSPLDGNVVTVEAIVTGDFQDGDADTSRDLRGFYLQEEDGDNDANLLTSEGIFVFEGNTSLVDVNVGDKVRITATVDEYFGETQLDTVTSLEILASDMLGRVTLTDISLPLNAVVVNSDGDYIGDLEQYEGMWVRFPDTLSITELFNLDRFGEFRVSEGGRLFQFTNSNAPSVAGYDAHLQDIAKRNIMVDDGLSLQNPDPIIYPDGDLGSDDNFRMGNTVTNLTGVVRFSRGSGGFGDETYRLLPTLAPSFEVVNQRPATPADVGGSLKVASFNVLNYFPTPDNSGPICGPNGNADCRGADSETELARQLEKLVTALVTMDADIVGLIELENNYTDGADSAAAKLVGALNTALGDTVYAYVDPGQNVGDDAIAVGFIYKVAAVDLAAGTTVEVLDDTDLSGLGLSSLAPLFTGLATNRAPLAATFVELSSGGEFTLAVNHFKSKGASGLSDTNDPNFDQGDGQGFWNQRRTDAATALSAWLATDPTGSGDEDFLIIGDLNAYPQEDPITELINQGYTSLFNTFGINQPYSFVFDGQAGALDYGLASSSLVGQVTGITEWHINADEPDAIDYNLDFGRNAGIFDGSIPFRASDHDPALIGLNLTMSDIEGIELTSVCSANPDATRGWRMKNPNDFAVEVQWQVYGTNQSGTVILPPAGEGEVKYDGATDGEIYTFFETATEGGNTLVVTYGNNQQLTKASSGAQCDGTSSLTILKAGNVSGTYGFTGDVGAFTLELNGEGKTFEGLNAGSYQIIEDATSFPRDDIALVAVSCVDDAGAAVEGSVAFQLGSYAATITVGLGEHLTCTFLNEASNLTDDRNEFQRFLPLVVR